MWVVDIPRDLEMPDSTITMSGWLQLDLDALGTAADGTDAPFVS